MKQTQILMGMPITVEIQDENRDTKAAIVEVFDYFTQVDNRFSTYKEDSEISQINRGLPKHQWSAEMTEVMRLCAETKAQTNGYFDIVHHGKTDPSGLVKGWAIQKAANTLRDKHYKVFFIEAGGDIQVSTKSTSAKPWTVGIRNPFNIEEIIKVLLVRTEGVATSGTYIRGEHIYNPKKNDQEETGVKSLTVIGPNIYEADRFATAAFAMGTKGILFIESLPGFEAYMVDKNKMATMTKGFKKYVG